VSTLLLRGFIQGKMILRLGSGANELWCTDYKGESLLGNHQYCYPLTVTDHASRFILQALSGFFVWSKSRILKEVVGAKGFEPSTSWSRTSGKNHISRCPGVTYWFSGRFLMDKS
jgi:hypothetical protein